jgi:hypothetical protein
MNDGEKSAESKVEIKIKKVYTRLDAFCEI